MTLKDKVVVITGSSSGIGQAIAVRFAEEGAKVVVNYRANREGGEETITKTKAINQDCLLIQADVSKPNDVKQLIKKTLQEFSKIDVFINNAAIGTDKVPFMQATDEDMKEVLDANIISVLLCSQQAAKIMEKQGYGKIINTSSVRGWVGGGRAPVYAASKAAVDSFTRTFAKQVAPKIQVNAVGPGFVKTRSYDDMPKEQIESFIDQTHLKRWVTKEEVADAFVFLAKNDAMTGQVIYVDAGYTLK